MVILPEFHMLVPCYGYIIITHMLVPHCGHVIITHTLIPHHGHIVLIILSSF
jgi:hypothetical protein